MNEVDEKNKEELQKMQDKSMKIITVTKLTQRKIVSQKTERQRIFKIIKIFLVPHNEAVEKPQN